MNSPFETFLAVLDIGGRLTLAEGGRLKMALPPDSPAALKETIHAHKDGLLALLAGPPFIVVQSEILQPGLMLWVATDSDRAFFLSLGAPAGMIYTRDELTVIVERNPDPQSLALIHQGKRMFGGGIVPHNNFTHAPRSSRTCNPNLQPDPARQAN